MILISLMQGRLLSKFEERFQAFPAVGWEKEFFIGQKLGLYSIEWIYEKPHADDNPLTSDSGISYLKDVIQKTDVQVKSICADYYMTEKLIENGEIKQENLDHLIWLIGQGKKLGVVYIVVPFVDISSLKTPEDRGALIKALRIVLRKTHHLGIEIHLETDLTPLRFKEVLETVNHPLLKMNYDIGNSASLGYDVNEEMTLLGKYLGSVHVKDRVLKGSTVPLGTGNANIAKCFEWFHHLHFNRWYVLQVARGVEEQEETYISSVIQYVRKAADGSTS